jgi:hypothetical protein
MTVAEFKEHLGWIYELNQEQFRDFSLSDEQYEEVKKYVRSQMQTPPASPTAMMYCECLILCSILRISRAADENGASEEIKALGEFVWYIVNSACPNYDYCNWTTCCVIGAFLNIKSRRMRAADFPLYDVKFDTDYNNTSFIKVPIKLGEVKTPGEAGRADTAFSFGGNVTELLEFIEGVHEVFDKMGSDCEDLSVFNRLNEIDEKLCELKQLCDSRDDPLVEYILRNPDADSAGVEKFITELKGR